jgi:hypothetical protein
MCVPALNKTKKARDRTPHENAWVANIGPTKLC